MSRNIQKEKITLSVKWEEVLPLYASMYSILNNTGKMQIQKELKIVGAKIDHLNGKKVKFVK